jgi:GTP-binding protein YchF
VRLGIIGLPASGKTTFFNIITGSEYPVGELSGGGRGSFESAIVDIPDPRMEKLGELLSPKKKTPARMTFVDVAGLEGKGEGTELPGWLINELAPMDAFIHVVRGFENDNVPHIAGSIDPVRDITAMEAEFILNDMAIVERRLERLKEEYQKVARDRGEIEREQSLLKRILEALNQERALRTITFTIEEERLLSSFGFISKKPLLLILNCSEGCEELEVDISLEGVPRLSIQGDIEMEIGQLPEDEAQIFREDYGIEEPGRSRILKTCSELLGKMTFFTFNENELRAWLISKGSTALDAAATIHTDIARGFIRAEIIDWQDLLDLGGMSQARSAGKLRTEGKNYQISDGEMIYIRFNI